MFETAELGGRVDKAEYERRVPALRTALLSAQRDVRQQKVPVLVVVAGVDGSGRGDAVNLLHAWLDPRGLQTHAFGAPTDEERERPPFWRYWRTLPPRGVVGVYFGSWYAEPIEGRTFGGWSERRLDAALARIVAFERALVDDGALVVKLWFHLSKKAQRKRFEALEADRATRWRVTKADWKRHESYGALRRTAERVLRETSLGEAPWTIVEAADPRARDLAMGEHLLAVMQQRLRRRPETGGALARPARALRRAGGTSILQSVDLDREVEREDYERLLPELQGRLGKLWRKAVARRISIVVVFEGFDAAGKGGAIRRLVPAMDARTWRIIPVAAPNDDERAHHWLWRFWQALPRRGRMTIFDRSWYGRVLVERVEGFATEDEWMRAYAEINDFEEQLVEHGIGVVKLWLHIDDEEQLRRFRARERTPHKRHKIGPEDYRNRKKRAAYEACVDDMVTRTSTDLAPWHLIPANDKRSARLDVLRIVTDAVERALAEDKRRRGGEGR